MFTNAHFLISRSVLESVKRHLTSFVRLLYTFPVHQYITITHTWILISLPDIFRFTFYWTLIFYIPVFVLCGIIAFINIAFAPNPYKNRLYPQTQFFYLFGSRFRLLRNNIRLRKASRATEETEEHPLALSTFSSAASPTSTTPFVPNVFPSADARNFNSQGLSSPTSRSVLGTAHPSASSLPSSRRLPPRPKTNVHRTRAVYALLVLLFFFASGLLGAVIGSAVVGYLLAALYKAGNFNMSTWVATNSCHN